MFAQCRAKQEACVDTADWSCPGWVLDRPPPKQPGDAAAPTRGACLDPSALPQWIPALLAPATAMKLTPGFDGSPPSQAVRQLRLQGLQGLQAAQRSSRSALLPSAALPPHSRELRRTLTLTLTLTLILTLTLT